MTGLFSYILFVIFAILILLEPYDLEFGWGLWRNKKNNPYQLTVEKDSKSKLSYFVEQLKLRNKEEANDFRELSQFVESEDVGDQISVSNILEEYKTQSDFIQPNHSPLFNQDCFQATHFRARYANKLIKYLEKNKHIKNKKELEAYIQDEFKHQWYTDRMDCSLQLITNELDRKLMNEISRFPAINRFLKSNVGIVTLVITVTLLFKFLSPYIPFMSLHGIGLNLFIVAAFLFLFLFIVIPSDLLYMFIFSTVLPILNARNPSILQRVATFLLAVITLIQFNSRIFGFSIAIYLQYYLYSFLKQIFFSKKGWKWIVSGKSILLFSILMSLYVLFELNGAIGNDRWLSPLTMEGWNVGILLCLHHYCVIFLRSLGLSNHFPKTRRFLVVFSKSMIIAFICVALLLYGRSYSLKINVFQIASLGLLLHLVFYILQYTSKLETLCVVLYLGLIAYALRVLVKSYEFEIILNLERQ